MEFNLQSQPLHDAFFQLKSLDQKFTYQFQKVISDLRQHYLDLHRSGRGHFFDDAKRIWLDMADQIETGKRSACVEAAFLASVPLVGSELYETHRALELKDWTKFAKAMLESIAEGAAVVLGMAATGAAGGAALGAIGFVPGMAFGAVSGFTVGASAGIASMTSVGAIGVMQYFDATLPVILACLYHPDAIKLMEGN